MNLKNLELLDLVKRSQSQKFNKIHPKDTLEHKSKKGAKVVLNTDDFPDI